MLLVISDRLRAMRFEPLSLAAARSAILLPFCTLFCDRARPVASRRELAGSRPDTFADDDLPNRRPRAGPLDRVFGTKVRETMRHCVNGQRRITYAERMCGAVVDALVRTALTRALKRRRCSPGVRRRFLRN